MRVWLVDDKRAEDVGGLQGVLRQLAELPGSGLTLLGSAPYRPDFVPSMRSLMPDLIVVNEQTWPEGPAAQEAFGLGFGVVVATDPERVERFRPLADQFPLVFIPHGLPADGVLLALASALAGQRRQAQWAAQ